MGPGPGKGHGLCPLYTHHGCFTLQQPLSPSLCFLPPQMGVRAATLPRWASGPGEVKVLVQTAHPRLPQLRGSQFLVTSGCQWSTCTSCMSGTGRSLDPFPRSPGARLCPSAGTWLHSSAGDWPRRKRLLLYGSPPGISSRAPFCCRVEFPVLLGPKYGHRLLACIPDHGRNQVKTFTKQKGLQ